RGSRCSTSVDVRCGNARASRGRYTSIPLTRKFVAAIASARGLERTTYQALHSPIDIGRAGAAKGTPRGALPDPPKRPGKLSISSSFSTWSRGQRRAAVQSRPRIVQPHETCARNDASAGVPQDAAERLGDCESPCFVGQLAQRDAIEKAPVTERDRLELDRHPEAAADHPLQRLGVVEDRGGRDPARHAA